MKKIIFALATLLIFVFILTSCGSKKETVQNSGSTPVSPAAKTKVYNNAQEIYADLAKLAPEERQKQLAEGAKKEGLVRFYTTLDEQIMEDIRKDFNEVYPYIKIEYISGKESDLESRAFSEFRGGKFLVDHFGVVGATATVNAEFPFAKHFGLPLPKGYPNAFYGDYWISLGYYPILITYNTNMVKASEAPKTYEDLLDPKWAGKVAIDVNPIATVLTFTQKWGEAKTRDYLNKLVTGNKAQLRKGHTQMLQMLAAGEFPIAAELFGYNLIPMAEKQGAPVGWSAADPVPAMITTTAIMNKAPHPYSAMIFFEYLLSEKGGKIIANYGRIPVNPQLKVASPGLESFRNQDVLKKLVPYSPEVITVEADKVAQKIINEILQKKL